MPIHTIDVDLVRAYVDHNDKHAFELLYKKYATDVRRAMARALSGFSSAEVDEFAQELWARGARLFEPYDAERGSVRTYLVVQATWGARSAEAKRMRRHASRRASQLPGSGQDPGAARCMSAWSLDNSDGALAAMSGNGARMANASEAIKGYLRENNDRPARVLQQWLDGRSGREIARDLGVHPAQISRDLARARVAMESFLPGPLPPRARAGSSRRSS